MTRLRWMAAQVLVLHEHPRAAAVMIGGVTLLMLARPCSTL